MSNLSFARIMYGASQEHPNSIWAPVSNIPSNLSTAPVGSMSLGSPASAKPESILQKAWHALTRHN